MSLIAIIILLLFIGMSALVSSSLIGTGNIGGANVVQSSQALAAAQAGEEWYLEQLQNDLDWTNEVDINNKSLSPGSPAFFDIDVTGTNLTTRVTFTSTGHVTNTDNLTVRRRMSVTAWKLPTAFQFALFEGTDPATQFDIPNAAGNTCVISGDAWLAGSDVDIKAGSTFSGIIYVPNSALVTGCAGVCSAKSMAAPFPAMPAITTTAYTTLMGTYDGVIPDANPPGGDLTINPPAYVVAGTVIADNINTNTANGILNITGCGRLVAWRNINLNRSASAVTRTLNVTPTCGDIEFLAGDNLNVGHPTDLDINVNINTGTGVTVFYSQAQGATTNQILIEGPNTKIHGARIYASRRITVQSDADVDQDSLLYIGRATSNANNQITITGVGTTVDGSILSTGRNNSNLQILTGATITGLVYSFDTGNNGRLEISGTAANRCTITGSVVADKYVSDDIRNATITYDPNAMPVQPPEGFDKFVMRKPNSWDGL